jgi:uncharacterized protein (DUF2132 family)
MIGRRKKTVKSAFGIGILQTFGKLDQRDIDEIDGRPERLVHQLIEQYGWTEAVARRKVDAFQSGLSKKREVASSLGLG